MDIPKVFVSATSVDLASARKAAVEALMTLQCLPVEQSLFPPDGRELRERLKQEIGDCQAVLHIAGFRYGGEPERLGADERRRSYTQIEVDVARELGKPVFLFLAEESFPFDNPQAPPEDEERRRLQREHREALTKLGPTYIRVRTEAELREKLRELQMQARELQRQLREQRAEASRHRRRTAAGALALLLILGAIGWGTWHLIEQGQQQRERDVAAATELAKANAAIATQKEEARRQAEQIARANAAMAQANAALEQQKERDRLNAGELAKANAALAEERKERGEARKILDDLRALTLRASMDKSDLTPAEREEEGLTQIVYQPGLTPEQIDGRKAEVRKIITKFNDSVTADPQADPLDKARAAHAQKKYSEAVALARRVADAAAEKLKTAPPAEREALRQRAVEGYRLAGQAEFMQVHYPAALEWNQKAVSLMDKAAKPLEWADAYHDVALGILLSGKKEESIAAAQELVDVLEKNGPPDSQDLGDALNMLATTEMLKDMDVDIGSIADRALAIHEKHPGPESYEVAKDLQLKGMYLLKHDEEGAIAVLEKSVAVIEKSCGRDDVRLHWSLDTLAMAYMKQNRYPEAETLQKRALALLEHEEGPEATNMVQVLNNLAATCFFTNRPEEGEKHMERAIQLAIKFYGENHEKTVGLLNTYASHLEEAGEIQKAREVGERLLGIEEKRLGLEDPGLVHVLNGLAAMYEEEKRLPAAEQALQRVIYIEEKNYGPDDPTVADGASDLGFFYKKNKRYPEAAQQYLRALAIDEETVQKNLPGLSSAPGRWLGYLDAVGKTAEKPAFLEKILGSLGEYRKRTNLQHPKESDFGALYFDYLLKHGFTNHEAAARIVNILDGKKVPPLAARKKK